MIDLKEFRWLISDIWKTHDNGKYFELSKEILTYLNTTLNPNKIEQQNILNSLMKTPIENLLISNLSEKFDYDRLSFAKLLIKELEHKKNQTLY